MATAKGKTEKLRERIDKDALSGLHRVIPAFKNEHREPIDAYLTSAEINEIIAHILRVDKEEGLKFVIEVSAKDITKDKGAMVHTFERIVEIKEMEI